jgi:beta-mannanase
VLPLLAALVLAAAAPAQGHVRTGRNLVPRHGALFGAFVNRSGDAYASVVGLQQQLGYRLTIVHHYRPWAISSYKIDQSAFAHRQIPMISWSPGGTTTASAIVSGSQDALITRTARDMKALRKKLFVRLAYEMDQPPGHPRYIGTPDEFVPAWRHVVRIFRRVGASNVRFVWCAIAANFKTGRAQAYYPGDRYVNWIAADGYNWYPARGKWAGYRTIFSSFYRWGSGHGKPLMIAETGSMEDPHTAGHKAHWLTRARRWVHAHGHLKALVYFDSVSPKGYDFRVQTSGSSFRAFRRWGRGTYWNRMR